MKKQRFKRRDSSRRGFTLIELLTVMVIMALMMSIAGVSFFKARQGAEMRGAVRAVQTTISLARQQAVVKRTPIRLTFANTAINNIQSGYMVMESVRSSDTNAAHATKFLPPLITFDSSTVSSPINFKTDGSAEEVGNFTITLIQNSVPPTQTNLTFNPLIGAMQE